ncbi:head-tail connector protein [Fodinicurvata fenggangensis]|uniref:head-tail connector protein n=1 Tax=Fodinicurvata fenggangensis TaxID=1121830 RepID=UPI000479E8F8|nr:head-tail connector protein [Fodinicurvata fenggangensis]
MLVQTTPPATDPLTLEDVKAHLKVEGTEEDGLISDLIAAAVQKIDGRDGVLGACLITQSWEATFDRFHSEIVLPLPPCQQVDSITYLDRSGTQQTLDSNDYRVTGLKTLGGARITPAASKSWPSTIALPDAVTVAFTAGFGDDPADIPEPVRAAMRLHIGHLYAHREGVVVGSITTEMPYGLEDLLRTYRVWRF